MAFSFSLPLAWFFRTVVPRLELVGARLIANTLYLYSVDEIVQLKNEKDLLNRYGVHVGVIYPPVRPGSDAELCPYFRFDEPVYDGKVVLSDEEVSYRLKASVHATVHYPWDGETRPWNTFHVGTVELVDYDRKSKYRMLFGYFPIGDKMSVYAPLWLDSKLVYKELLDQVFYPKSRYVTAARKVVRRMKRFFQKAAKRLEQARRRR